MISDGENKILVDCTSKIMLFTGLKECFAQNYIYAPQRMRIDVHSKLP